MAEIAAAHVQRGVVEVADRTRDGAGQDRAGGERANFQHQKYHARRSQMTTRRYGPSAPMEWNRPWFTITGRKQNVASTGCHRACLFLAPSMSKTSRVRTPCEVWIEPVLDARQSAFGARDLFAGDVGLVRRSQAKSRAWSPAPQAASESSESAPAPAGRSSRTSEVIGATTSTVKRIRRECCVAVRRRTTVGPR